MDEKTYAGAITLSERVRDLVKQCNDLKKDAEEYNATSTAQELLARAPQTPTAE